MSYPRNAASPPVYDVGSLVQISDGALQTTGASARVKIGTGSWGAAAGSLDCDATSGIWTYIPSQAETNAESFIVAVYKTGSISISRTVVPSASTVAGRTMPADGSITAAVIATDAIDADSLKADAITEIQNGLATQTSVDDLPTNAELAAALASSDDAMLAAIANVQTDTNDIQTRLPAALVGGKMDAIAELDSAVGTQITNIENASGYLLAVLAGACADPQTASETYAITVFGSTFTVDMAGQTSTGTRTAPTLTKA